MMSRLALLLLASMAAPLLAGPIQFDDNFEAATLNPFWGVVNGSGSVSLTNALAHGGSQSARFSTIATPGVGKNVSLFHDFATPVYGRASVWVCDNAANVLSSNYLSLIVSRTDVPQSRGILSYDYDLGPGQNGSTYYLSVPGEVQTGVDRTVAWHQFTIDTTPARADFFIDGSLVYSQPTGFAFNRVEMRMFGPDSRPAWTTSFDDFAFREFQVPEPASLLVFGGIAAGLVGGFLRRRRAGGAA